MRVERVEGRAVGEELLWDVDVGSLALRLGL